MSRWLCDQEVLYTASSGTPIMPCPRSERLSDNHTLNISRLDLLYVARGVAIKDHLEASTEAEKSGMGSEDNASVCHVASLLYELH